MMNKITTFLLAFIAIMTIASCNEDSNAIFEDQVEEIKEYIADNNLTMTEIEDYPGIYYAITTPGTGTEYPTVNSSVTVDYTGYLLDGTIFDSSSSPIEFELSSLITGWKVGLLEFKKGDAGMLIIPSKYGYGSSTVGTIPGNSILVFDIELVDFD